MQISTTGDEDRKAQTILEDALDAAYTAGRDDAGNYTRNFGSSSAVDAHSLWERLCDVLGVSV